MDGGGHRPASASPEVDGRVRLTPGGVNSSPAGKHRNAPHNMRPVGRGRLCTRRTHSDIRGQAAALEEPAARSGSGGLVTRLAQHTYLTPLISRVIGLLAAARAHPRTIAVPPTKPKYGTSSVGS